MSSMASTDGRAQEEPWPRRSVNRQPLFLDDHIGPTVQQTPDCADGSRITPHMIIQEMRFLSSLDPDVLRGMLAAASPELYED